MTINNYPEQRVLEDKYGEASSDKDEPDLPVVKIDIVPILPHNGNTSHSTTLFTTHIIEKPTVCFPNGARLKGGRSYTSFIFPRKGLGQVHEIFVKLDNTMTLSLIRKGTVNTERRVTASSIAKIQFVSSEKIVKRKRFSSPKNGTLLV